MDPPTGDEQRLTGLGPADMFRIVADSTRDWEFWLSPQRHFVYVSPSCQRISGRSPDYFDAAPALLDLVHADDRLAVEVAVAHALDERGSGEIDVRLSTDPDDQPRWVALAYGPISSPEGSFLGMRGSIRDISARKQAVEAARQRAAEIDALLASLPSGVAIYNKTGQMVRANAAARAMLDFSAAERRQPVTARAAGRHVIDADGQPIPPDQVPTARALRGETVHNCVLAFHASGEPAAVPSTWLLASSAPIMGPDGQPAGAVSTFMDISELRAVEERLAAANARLTVQAEEMEVQAEELRSQNDELVQLTNQLQAANQRLLQQAEELEVQSEELQAQNDELTRMSEELRAERAFLEAVVRQMPAGALIANVSSGEVLLTNEQMSRVWRREFRSASEVINFRRQRGYRPDGSFYEPQDWPIARAMAHGQVVTGEEIRILRGDSTWGTVLVSAAPILNQAGQVTWAVATFTDITDLKQVEDELRRVRDELELRVQARTTELARANQALQYQAGLLANVNDAVIATNAEGRITAWNHAAEEMYGWTANETAGRLAGELVQARLLGLDDDEAQRILHQTGRLRGEAIHRRRDGTEIVVEATTMALEGGVGYVAVHRDVTRRRQAEQALRESEELLRQFAENVQEVFWITTLRRDRVLYVNSAYERIWGRTCQSLYQDPQSFMDSIHPEDRAKVSANRLSLAEGGSDVPLRLLQPGGGLRWVQVRTFPIRDAQGEVYRIAGIAEDISERVQAYQLLEQRVAERTHELSTLLAVSNEVVSNLKIESLLNVMADQLQRVIACTGLVIFRLLEREQELMVVEYRGPMPRSEALHARLPLADALGLSDAIRQRRPLLISDLQGDSVLAQAWPGSALTLQKRLTGPARSWLAVPLLLHDRPIGVLRLAHDEPDRFTDHHAALALAFANQAAVAMENARLYEEAQAVATIEERQRLARDLHDAVSQTLFSASLVADVLPDLYAKNPQRGQEMLAELRQLNRGAMAEMRMLLLELRPQTLVDVDLSTLLHHLGEAATARGDLKVELDVKGQGRPPAEVQLALYRIAQESINNVIKHARARRLAIRLRCGQQARAGLVVQLGITDDGCGFDKAAVRAGSLGIGIMTERAAFIGAALTIESQLGKGTRVAVRWRERPARAARVDESVP